MGIKRPSPWSRQVAAPVCIPQQHFTEFRDTQACSQHLDTRHQRSRLQVGSEPVAPSVPVAIGRGSRLGVSRWHPPYQSPSISVPAVRNGSVRTVTEASSPRDLLPGGPPLSDHHLARRSGTRRPARTLSPRRWRTLPQPLPPETDKV